jgi:hypothetical protein
MLDDPANTEADDGTEKAKYKLINDANYTYKAIVGQRINLAGFLKRANDNTDVEPLGDVTWLWCHAYTTAGDTIGETKNYQFVLKNGQIDPPPDPATRYQHFNWYTGGSFGGTDILVCLSATKGGEVLDLGFEHVKVYRPRFERMTLAPGPIKLSVPLGPISKLFCGDPNPAVDKPGMKATASLSAPQTGYPADLSGSGFIAILQTTNFATKYWIKDVPNGEYNSHGWVLDRTNNSGNDPMYPGTTKEIAASGQRDTTLKDWPNSPLFFPDDEKVRAEPHLFFVWLMYKPLGVNSIWTSTAKGWWHYCSGATFQRGSWKIDYGEKDATGGGPAEWMEPPEWSNYSGNVIDAGRKEFR